MVAMARALMSRPKLLMLDEPSMGLAPMMVTKIFETIRDISAQGVSILLVEQLIEKALAVSDRVVALTQGRVVLVANSREPDLPHQLEQAYFGAGH